MVLERVEIFDFEKHISQCVEFDPKLTTIIGPTDAGKSAILRAVRWACLNQPAGVAMVRQGSAGAEVTVIVDGHSIRRIRKTTGTNIYELDGAELVAFGLGVPQSIQKLLCLDRLNFVGQKDPDFWFSASPSEVSSSLNAVVDLGIIDSTNQKIGKLVWQVQDDVRVSDLRISEVVVKQTACEWAVVADAGLVELESIAEKYKEIVSRWSRLFERCHSYSDQLKKISRLSGVVSSISRLKSSHTEWSDVVERREILRGLMGSYRKNQSRLRVSVDFSFREAYQNYEAARKTAADLRGVVQRASRLRKQIDGSSELLVKSQKLNESYGSLDTVISKIDRLSHLIETHKSAIADVRTLSVSYAKQQSELSVYRNAACPLCGRV